MRITPLDAVCRQAVVERHPALAGHAAFEAYSVLTRLPLPLRLTSMQAAEVLGSAFPEPCWLDARSTQELYEQLADLGIAGGSVYDALVAWAAEARSPALADSRDTCGTYVPGARRLVHRARRQLSGSHLDDAVDAAELVGDVVVGGLVVEPAIVGRAVAELVRARHAERRSPRGARRPCRAASLPTPSR